MLSRTDAPSTDTLRGHRHVVLDLTFTPGGDRLVSGSSDASVRVWNLDTGRSADTLVTDVPAPFVAVSPDGRRLAAGGADGGVRTWRLDQLDSDGTVLSSHSKTVTGVAFSPCSDRVASSGLDGRVRIARLEGNDQACPEAASAAEDNDPDRLLESGVSCLRPDPPGGTFPAVEDRDGRPNRNPTTSGGPDAARRFLSR